MEEDIDKREEERLMKSLAKKRNPGVSAEEAKKKKDAEQKRKAEQDKRKQLEEEEIKKKKQNEEARKKKMDEYLREKQQEEEIQKQQQQLQQRQKDEQLREQQTLQLDQLKQETEQRKKDELPPQHEDSEQDQEALRREAARMAKMFGGMGISADTLMSSTPKKKPETSKPVSDPLKHLSEQHNQPDPALPPVINLKSEKLVIDTATQNFEDDEERRARIEEERFARQLSGKTVVWTRGGPSREEIEQIEKEKRLRDLKEKIDILGASATNDPQSFSKAFLNDPDMAAHLKDATGLKAEHTLSGLEIPGGHKFSS